MRLLIEGVPPLVSLFFKDLDLLEEGGALLAIA